MADFWRGFGEGFGKSWESSFESASKRLEERRKLERAAKAAREKAVSGLMAQGRGVELHGGNPRELFSKGERDAADLALGPTKGGVRDDGVTPILPEMQRAPFKDMVSGATKSQIDAAAAFAPSLREQLGEDREARREGDKNLGASLATPLRDFELTEADLKGKTSEQIKYMRIGAAGVKRKVLEPFKSEIYNNQRRAINIENDRRNFLGNPSTYNDVATFYSTLKIPDLVQVMSDDNIKQREAENKILGEYVSITKNPYVMPHSKIAEEADLIASINRQAEALADTDLKDPKYEGLDKTYEESKISLAKLRGEVGVNFSELEELIAKHKRLDGQKDAQRKLIWDTNARAAIARVDEFKKIIDPESFEGGEEGSFDDPKSLYRTTYFKEVKDPVTEQTYTDVVSAFYPWLNKFNINVPPPTAAGLQTVINIGTGGRQESIVYMPEGVATDAKGQKPKEGEVEDSKTVVFERKRRPSNMTKAQRDIIDKARKSFKSSSKPKEIQGRTVKSSYDIKTDERIEDEEKEWLLNQEEEVIFTNERGEEFIRIKDTIHRLK